MKPITKDMMMSYIKRLYPTFRRFPYSTGTLIVSMVTSILLQLFKDFIDSEWTTRFVFMIFSLNIYLVFSVGIHLVFEQRPLKSPRNHYLMGGLAVLDALFVLIYFINPNPTQWLQLAVLAFVAFLFFFLSPFLFRPKDMGNYILFFIGKFFFVAVYSWIVLLLVFGLIGVIGLLFRMDILVFSQHILTYVNIGVTYGWAIPFILMQIPDEEFVIYQSRVNGAVISIMTTIFPILALISLTSLVVFSISISSLSELSDFSIFGVSITLVPSIFEGLLLMLVTQPYRRQTIPSFFNRFYPYFGVLFSVIVANEAIRSMFLPNAWEFSILISFNLIAAMIGLISYIQVLIKKPFNPRFVTLVLIGGALLFFLLIPLLDNSILGPDSLFGDPSFFSMIRP